MWSPDNDFVDRVPKRSLTDKLDSIIEDKCRKRHLQEKIVGNTFNIVNEAQCRERESPKKINGSACGVKQVGNKCSIDGKENERRKITLAKTSQSLRKSAYEVKSKKHCGGGDREYSKSEGKAEVGVQVGYSMGSYSRKQATGKITFRDLIQKILFSKDNCIHWLMENGYIKNKRLCPECGEKMKLISVSSERTSDGYQWRCRRNSPKNHDIRLSLRHGSWFANANMTLEEILEMTYWWCLGLTQVQVQEQMGCSSATAVDWYSFCREVCEVTELNETQNGKQIGGPGIIVEIDESKFAKRKYHRGHEVKLGWVFGGREREDGRNCFMVVVEDRSAATLLTLIQKHIARGSIIYSDCWKAYSKLEELGYSHLTVNHSENFKDPETGCHTNGIEGDWQKAKHGHHMPQFGIKNKHLPGYLAVFMWRRKHEGKDMFMQFLNDATKLDQGYCKSPTCKHCQK